MAASVNSIKNSNITLSYDPVLNKSIYSLVDIGVIYIRIRFNMHFFGLVFIAYPSFLNV